MKIFKYHLLFLVIFLSIFFLFFKVQSSSATIVSSCSSCAVGTCCHTSTTCCSVKPTCPSGCTTNAITCTDGSGCTYWSTCGAYSDTSWIACGGTYCSSANNKDCLYGCTPTTSGGTCKSAPKCNSGKVYGACSKTACGVTGTKSCTYTTYTGGGTCTKTACTSVSCTGTSCAATVCGSSSSSSTDAYCTYLTGGYCSSGQCWYTNSYPYNSNCGSTCVAARPCTGTPVYSACTKTCGGGTQTCKYTTYSGSTSCTKTTCTSRACNTQACTTATPAPTPTPVPTPTPTPTCNSGVTCGACSIVNPSCGTGSKACTYTTYTGGGTCTPASAPSQSCTVGCSGGYVCSSGTCTALSTININVYYDYNGNGAQDPGETAASGQTVTVTGGGAQTYTTNGAIKTISNLNPGSSTISVTLPGATWKSTTTNPVTVSYPPPATQTVNIGIQPPAPTCSGAGGGLTASPTSVNPGGTSTLTTAGCTSPTGGALSYTYYDDSTIVGDSVTNNNTNTSTWTAPNPYWTQTIAHPSVAVCNPGGSGALCSNYGTSITIVPIFSISGNVFIDANKNQLKDAGESNYTPITITSTGGSVTYPSGGVFKINNLPAGTYTISYTSLPSGSQYQMTFPVNGPPPFFTVTVGAGCTVGISNSASCDANNNIINLNYGITNSIPWIQGIGGGDIGGNGSISSGGSGTGGTTGGGGTGGTGATGGFNNPIPSTALAICGGPYASVPGSTSTTPGLIFTGNGSAYFGQGSASLNNWLVGGTNYPESFGPVAQGGLVKTSYAYLQSVAKQASITPTDILPFCGAGGLNSCNLNSSTLPHGIYIANGNLTLTGNGTPSTYIFPSNQNYIILVGKNLDGSNGNLNIQTQLHVPVGSTALFSASGDINVDKSVGEQSYQSSTSDIEGVFSADQSFIISGQNDCTIGPDLRLNVAGSIITNAALNGGTFTNQRDLCANDIYCPVFTVQSRPDFILNAPDFIKKANYTWQELAP